MLDLVTVTIGTLVTATISMCSLVGLYLIAIDARTTIGGRR